MTRSQLVQSILRDNPHLYRRDIQRLVATVFDEIAAALGRGDRVELRGFGAFIVQAPAGAAGAQPAHRRSGGGSREGAPFFKPGKQLRERINDRA